MNKVFGRITKQLTTYAKENAPTILAVVGSMGVVATSVSSINAYKRYTKKIDTFDEPTTSDKIKTAIPAYAPTVLIGASSIMCIVGSNILNKKKQAAMTSAYLLLDSSFKEYREKVKQIYGDDADNKIESEIMKDNIDTNEFNDDDVRLFFEPITRTYFEASISDVQRAEYLLNREMALTDYVRVNDFLKFLGQDKTDIGDVLGWSTFQAHQSYGYAWIDFKHERVEMEDGLECYVIKYPQEPSMDYLDV